MTDRNPPNLLTYIYELENANERLLKSLKRCLQIFNEIGPLVQDEEIWEDILGDIRVVIGVADKLYDQRKPN